MGVWSEPLFVYCQAKIREGGDEVAVVDPNDIIIDFTCLGSNSRLRALEQHGIDMNGKISLNQSFMAMCNSARVYGYLNTSRVDIWTAYMCLAFDQNPMLNRIELYMYSSDTGFPYYFAMSRSDKVIVINTLPIGHVLYSNIEEDTDSDGTQYVVVKFDRDMFRERIKVNKYRNSIFGAETPANVDLTILRKENFIPLSLFFE